MNITDKIDGYLTEQTMSSNDLKSLRQSFIDIGIKSGIVVDVKGKVIVDKGNKTPESTIFKAIDDAGFEVTGGKTGSYTIKKS